MPEIQLPIIKGDAISVDVDYRDQLPVNLVAIPRQVLGANGYLLTHSGLDLFAAGLPGPDRGGVWNERLQGHFRVSGDKFIEVQTNGTFLVLGDVPGADRAKLPYSFNTQAIIANGAYYLYDRENGFRQVTDPDLGTPSDATWVDGYYFFTDGETLYHTNIANESQIDPLDFATSEFSPDPTIGVERNYDNTVIAFNRYTTEYFANDATDDFAFRRIQSRAKSIGIVGRDCKARLNQEWFILGGAKEEQPTIYVMTTSARQKIATREIDLIIDKYSEEELAKTVIETRQEDDMQLILFKFPEDTVLYNHTIGQQMGLSVAWSLLRDEVTTDGDWPGVGGIYDPRISEWIYGDNMNRLGRLDRDICTIYGNQIETIFYTPLVKFDRASIDKIEIESIPGGAGGEVTCFISATYDGVAFNQEREFTYGTPNNRSTRFIRRRLGYVRDFAGYKIRSVTGTKVGFARLELSYG